MDKDRKPLAGIRMEIPERLRGDHKALEVYGHHMKTKHGDGFKRHTKLDDEKMCLYMDAYIPRMKSWVRIDVDQAKSDNEKRRKKQVKIMDSNALSTVSDEEDEPKT